MKAHLYQKKNFLIGVNFKSAYLGRVRSEMEELIFATDDYKMIQDGANRIYYTNYYPIYGIEDCGNFLIIYKDKALTNIPFKEETNTLAEIKEAILKQENNKVTFCYENDEYTSNKESFLDDYTTNFLDHNTEITYYSSKKTGMITRNDYSGYGYASSEYDDYPEIEEIPEVATNTSNYVVSDTSTAILTTDTTNATEDVYEDRPEQYTATLEDFTIYTSFIPKLPEGSDIKLVIDIMTQLKPYEQQIMIAMPVSVILTLLISIFLINSIGHVKGKDEIELTDFDKIPLEIPFIIILLIVALLGVSIEELAFESVVSQDTFLTTVATIYIIIAVLTEILLVTIIARIKAKKFLDTCICGRLFKWSVKILSKILDIIKNWIIKFFNGIKKVKQGISENIKLTWKLVGAIGIYIIVSIVLLGIFGGFGIALDGFLLLFVIYQMLARVNSFVKLEAGLKEIYEGNNTIRLYKDDFTKEFENCVDYVNDISNGFENAVEESLKSERLKTELITNVSHDIKTPLTSIINYVDLIKKENIDNDKLKEYVDILDSKSQRLKKLTEDLVEASKASSGNVSLNLEEIGLIELLNQLIGEYKDKFEEKNLEIVTNLSKVNVKVKADSRYLYRVIDNLFGNISKYALEGSRVYVETEIMEAGRVKVILKNISKEKLNISEEELMQRFVRGDKSRTTEGSGLGLAIARSLTELQKGTLNCKIDGDLFKVEVEFNLI